MSEFDASTGECFVTTYREGLFSALGHDLKLRVTDFRILLDAGFSIQAEFRADSLRVVGSLKDGRVDELEPGPKDRESIHASIVNEVLEARKFPAVKFRSTAVEKAGDRYAVRGRLDLHGRERDVQFTVETGAGRAVAKVSVHQPDFGIQPYRALLGALRVKPDVLVEVSVPYGAG
jgi:YceI-like protein